MKKCILLVLLAIYSFPVYSQNVQPRNGNSARYLYQGKTDIEKEWGIFFSKFQKAISDKDIVQIKKLTTADFFDGGGGYTIEEWLNEIVFIDNKRYEMFKKEIAGKIISKHDNGVYKVTGNGEPGHLFFMYKNSEWKFGGVIGD